MRKEKEISLFGFLASSLARCLMISVSLDSSLRMRAYNFTIIKMKNKMQM
jgi:hypothetical protein